jgi:hypothetical protein
MKKTHCAKCKVKLDKNNTKTYNGTTYGQCKKCIIQKVKEHNKKRQKAIKDSKWF